MRNFISILCCEHSQLDLEMRDKIIAVKQDSWKYSYSSQVQWMEQNLNDADLHYLFMIDNELVAYCSLSRIKCEINGIQKLAKGLGSVCVKGSYKGMGIGKLLFNSVTLDLVVSRELAFLLCKDSLVPFYKSNQKWALCDSAKINVEVDGQHFDSNVFYINDSIESGYILFDRLF